MNQFLREKRTPVSPYPLLQGKAALLSLAKIELTACHRTRLKIL